MNIEIRHPDIKHLAVMAKKYANQINSNREDIDEIFANWQEIIFIKMLSEIQISYSVQLFPTETLLSDFIEDATRRALSALFMGWAIGREYAETYSEKAKIALAISGYESVFLLPTTKSELVDVADYAAEPILLLLCNLQKRLGIPEKESLYSIEVNQNIFRQGLLLAFKSGVSSLFKSNE